MNYNKPFNFYLREPLFVWIQQIMYPEGFYNSEQGKR